MTLLVIFASVVAGALWRRWHGMGQGPRIVRLLVAFLLCWPLLFTGLPYWAMGLLALAVTLYWVPGHDWTSARALLLRYGPTPVALGYLWAHQINLADPQALKWNRFIDGPLALAELHAGAWVFGTVALIVPLCPI